MWCRGSLDLRIEARAVKANRPPGDGALIELAKLHGHTEAEKAAVVSLTDYAALAEAAC